MNPDSDIICELLKTPFAAWSELLKKATIAKGRPVDVLSVCAKRNTADEETYNITFRPSVFLAYKWLCSSQIKQKLFCWSCLLFSNKRSVWNREGFTDWWRIAKELNHHEKSAEHLQSEHCKDLFEKEFRAKIEVSTCNIKFSRPEYNEYVRQNRLFLQTVIDGVLYLCKYDAMKQENFEKLLSLLISQNSLENKNRAKIGDWETVQNELMDCISDYIFGYVKNENKQAKFFSIQVDRVSDIFRTSLVSRFVDSEGTLVQRFLGLHGGGLRTPETFHKTLAQFNYKNKLVGQSYDWTSIMFGLLIDFQANIKKMAPYSIFVHSIAHPFSSMLQQIFERNSKFTSFFSTLSEMSSFFRYSILLRNIPFTTQTNWSSNAKLLEVIVDDWCSLKQVFEYIANSKAMDQRSIAAKTFLNIMNDSEFTFLALVFSDILPVLNVLFEGLQKNSLNIDFILKEIGKTSKIVGNKQNECFETLFDRTKSLTKQNIDSDKKYRVTFNEILGRIHMEITFRFQDYKKLQFVCLADTTKFEQYCSNFPEEAFDNFYQVYGKVFEKNQRLKNELGLIYADETCRNISLPELVTKLNEYKTIFAEAYALFCLILTIPSICATTGFCSYMKRLEELSKHKSHGRLSSFANISINEELLVKIIKEDPFYDNVIDKFAALSDERFDLLCSEESLCDNKDEAYSTSTEEDKSDSWFEAVEMQPSENAKQNKRKVEDEAQPNTTQRKSAAHDDVPKKRRKIGKTLAQTAVASTSRLQDPLAMEDGLEQNRIMDEENAFEDDIQHSDNSISLSRIDFVDVKREDIDVIDIKEEPIRFDESTDIDLPAYISQGELHIKEEKKDQCEQFGEFVSVSLEQLPEDQATLAQNDIENVLMKFKMLAANTLTH